MKSSLMLLTLAILAVAPGQSDGMRMNEMRLRVMATAAPLPVYPRESLAAKVAGVAVAAVRFDVDGRAQSVEILEAPDEHTAAAVREAVSRWTVPGVKVNDRPEAVSVRGKLTFYFQLRDGKGRVVNPDDMPGAAPRSPRPAMPPPTSGPPAVPLAGPPARPTSMSGSHGEDLDTITVTDFKKESERAHVVLDIGERDAFKRGHWPGAINIPFDELAVRAGIELPRDSRIVIDCTQEDLTPCRRAGGRPVEQKFTDVVLLVR